MELAGGLNQISLSVRTLEATAMEMLVNKQVVTIEEWMAVAEGVYKQLLATAEQATADEEAAIINEDPPADPSPIIV